MSRLALDIKGRFFKMKKLLGVLATLTLASGVIAPAVYPIHSVINTNSDNNIVPEAQFVSETRSAMNDAFESLQSEFSEFSVTATYATIEGTEINGKECLDIAKQKSNDLLTEFSESENVSEAQFIEFLREKVPSFNDS